MNNEYYKRATTDNTEFIFIKFKFLGRSWSVVQSMIKWKINVSKNIDKDKVR